MDKDSFSQTLKDFVKRFIFRPRALGTLGNGSWVKRPWKIEGGENISIGHSSLVREHAWLVTFTSYAGITLKPKLSIGNDVYIGRYSCLTSGQNVVIEDGCVLSEYVYVTDNLHGINPNAGHIMRQPLTLRPVHIGRNCFLGYRVAVMPGVTLGEHCVVASNSVVSKSFPAYSMIGGIPAKLIKSYSSTTGKWEAVPGVTAAN